MTAARDGARNPHPAGRSMPQATVRVEVDAPARPGALPGPGAFAGGAVWCQPSLGCIPLSRRELDWAQDLVAREHYLRKRVDARCSVEGYGLAIASRLVGVFLVGRPQATACYPWYGSVADVATGRAAVTRWQVLNLARVYFDPAVQRGGALHRPGAIPGFHDRRGVWRSTLGSASIAALAYRVVADYLLARPPCFLEEPYELRWLLSYCDTRLHRGTLYRAAGFELVRTNRDGIQTWRLPLRPLTAEEDACVRLASTRNARSIAYRRRRAQRVLQLGGAAGYAAEEGAA